MILVSIILPICLLVLTILILMGLYNSLNKDSYEGKSSEENISIIIPVKNESGNLPKLLTRLRELNYPRDNFEVIFVDDDSEDNSLTLIEQNLQENYRLIKSTNKKYPAKKGALDIGIRSSKFNTIAITDADCEPETDWLKSISQKISQGYDVIFGYSPLKANNKLISKISPFENLRNYILYFSAVGLGIPYSATSRSLAFTKQAYNKINGYSNTLETLSGDDDLFIREAVKQKMKIGVFRNSNDLVYSNPAESFKDYFHRKSRHLKTSHHYLFKHQILLGLWHSINILSLYSIFLIILSPPFVIPFLTKMILDIFTIMKVRNNLPHEFNWLDTLRLQVFYETFLIINFINSFVKKDKWK